MTKYMIPLMQGRVRFVTGNPGNFWITVENPKSRLAFRFSARTKKPVRDGEWLEFRGKSYFDFMSTSCDEAGVPYRHKPFDNSDQKDWRYFDLTGVKYSITGPPEFTDALKICEITTRRHLNSYYHNRDSNKLKDTIRATERQLKALQTELKIVANEEKDATSDLKCVELDLLSRY